MRSFRRPYKLAKATTTDITPPVTHPRIDLVQARLDTWDVSSVKGTRRRPVAPEAEANCLALAHLYCGPHVDCSRSRRWVNGYIVDARTFI
jgi:hypothetical protein